MISIDRKIDILAMYIMPPQPAVIAQFRNSSPRGVVNCDDRIDASNPLDEAMQHRLDLLF